MLTRFSRHFWLDKRSGSLKFLQTPKCIIFYMGKRRLGLLIAGVILVFVCLFFATLSLRRLPPESVRPNAKPAIAQTYSKGSLFTASAASQVQQASPILAETSAKTVPLASTKQPESKGRLISSPASRSAFKTELSVCPSNILTSQSSHLQSAILNIASRLN